jgi:hypothetical protein
MNAEGYIDKEENSTSQHKMQKYLSENNHHIPLGKIIAHWDTNVNRPIRNQYATRD